MQTELPIRQPSLSQQVFEILASRISNGEYAPNRRLPPEHQLAEELNVSRATIRRALDRLVDRGLVRRRQGIGNFVTNLPGMANPLDTSGDFVERIAERGFTPRFLQFNTRIVETPRGIAEKLDIKPGSPSLTIHKVFTADKEPVIYFINHIPVWVFEDRFSLEEITEPGFTEPLFTFFKCKCGKRIEHLYSSLRPAIARGVTLPGGLSFPDRGAPILIVEDVGYTEGNRPALHSVEHLAGIASAFDLLRRIED